MVKKMLVHDRRLEGAPPPIAQNTFRVDQTMSTNHIVDWIATYAQRQHPLDDLIIMCHGYSSDMGFEGLQLGRDDLSITNLVRTQSWRPNIRNIFLYSCGPASASILGDPAMDGRQFCSELAAWTGANVYAADASQVYHRVRTRWEQLIGTNRSGTIDFGTWEGQVYRFLPAGGQPTPVRLSRQPVSR